MRFILHSNFNAGSVRDNLGKPTYSYYFVLKTFLPVIEQLGSVTIVEQADETVDAIYDECRADGEPCVFISFSPPNYVPLNLRCPSTVVFAWEFSNFPDGGWENSDPRDDWRHVFAKLGAAITLSTHMAEVTREAMGTDYPVYAIASPVWNRRPRPPLSPTPIVDGAVQVRGDVIDTVDYVLSPDIVHSPLFPPAPVQVMKLTTLVEEPVVELEAPEPAPAPEPEPEPIVELLPPAVIVPERHGVRYRLAVTKRHTLEWYREAVRDLLPRPLTRAISGIGIGTEAAYRRLTGWAPPVPPPPPPPPPLPPLPPPIPMLRVKLDGVVYTSMFDPADGRKNWHDLLTGFCYAFRDVEDATLVMKMVKTASLDYRRDLFLLLARLKPYKCRVVTMNGFLEDADYDTLIASTTYYVNTSHCEGLCMPMMEFMSAGKPAVAPRHTAMMDYIEDSAAFIVGSTPEHNVWPGDPRYLFSTMRERIRWDTLVDAYRESYRVAKEDPERYAAMGRNAADIIRNRCADEIVREQLKTAVDEILRIAAAREPDLPPVEQTTAEEPEIAQAAEPA